MRREQVIASMRTHAKRFDLIIIGGGATGIGAALEASARGYSVALLEPSRFCERNFQSIDQARFHGGLRYLKQGNVRLVKEAMWEREILAQNAPHLFKEQPFLIPNRSYWQQLFYGIGLKLYDFLAKGSSLSASVFLNRKKRCN